MSLSHEEFESGGGEGGDHSRWIFSYSDLVTLLLALFIVLYSISSVNEKKYKELNTIMSSAFPTEQKNSSKNSKNESTSPNNQNPKQNSSSAELKDKNEAGFDAGDFLKISNSLNLQKDTPNPKELRTFKGTSEFIELTIDSDFMFSPGSAYIDTDGKEMLKRLSETLSEIPFPIRIEGHTDSTPIDSILYPSNWDLSVARAASVVRTLELFGIDSKFLSAVGYGSEFPVAPNDTPQGRALNRRVVIIINKNDPRFNELLDHAIEVEKTIKIKQK